MDNLIISRTDFDHAIDIVDSVSGTVTVTRCVEDGAARHFPNEKYLEYLKWLDSLNREGIPESPYADLSPANRFERNVAEVMILLENDGSLYLGDYRTFIFEDKQIAYVLHQYYGMAWVFTQHVSEAVKRKRSRRK